MELVRLVIIGKITASHQTNTRFVRLNKKIQGLFKDFQGHISHFLRTTEYIQCQKRALSLCLVLVLPLNASKFNFVTYPGVPVL